MLGKLNKIREYVDKSPYLAGLTMIMLNIGSRYVELGFTKTQEQALRNGLAREIMFFSIFYMVNRDIVYSILMTAAFIIMADHLFNDESRFCVIPQHIRKISLEIDRNGDNVISEKEEQDAIDILRKAKMQKKKTQQAKFTSMLSGSTYSDY